MVHGIDGGGAYLAYWNLMEFGGASAIVVFG